MEVEAVLVDEKKGKERINGTYPIIHDRILVSRFERSIPLIPIPT